MSSLSGQFLDIEKKIRQMAVQKMQKKMEHAAEMTMKAADKSRDYNDVTGNLYKGTYYNGSIQSIHYAPGPDPTRPTLAAGERYNLDRYYRSSFSFKDSGRKPYRGEYGEGGENGSNAAWDEIVSREHNKGRYDATWQMLLVAGVDYAKYVEVKKGHDVISSLREYLIRYFKKI